MKITRAQSLVAIDTTDATATADQILDTETAYINSILVTGTMPNNAGDVAAESAHMGTTTTIHVVPAEGYTDGVNDATTIDLATVDTDLVAGNVKHGVALLGVTGTYDTEAGNPIATDTVLLNKIGFVNGTKITGSMANNAASNVEVTDVDGTLIPTGYYDGTGSAVLSAAEAAKVIAGNILSGVTLLGVEGDSNVVDTSDGDAIDADILVDKVAYVGGAEITGTMLNIADADTEVTTLAGTAIPAGYHNGSGTAILSAAEIAKIIPENIKSGVTILGVEGTYTGA